MGKMTGEVKREVNQAENMDISNRKANRLVEKENRRESGRKNSWKNDIFCMSYIL